MSPEELAAEVRVEQLRALGFRMVRKHRGADGMEAVEFYYINSRGNYDIWLVNLPGPVMQVLIAALKLWANSLDIEIGDPEEDYDHDPPYLGVDPERMLARQVYVPAPRYTGKRIVVQLDDADEIHVQTGFKDGYMRLSPEEAVNLINGFKVIVTEARGRIQEPWCVHCKAGDDHAECRSVEQVNERLHALQKMLRDQRSRQASGEQPITHNPVEEQPP